MYVLIHFIDGTKSKEYTDEVPRVKDGLLILYKGRFSPALYVNMQTVKSFQEVEH